MAQPSSHCITTLASRQKNEDQSSRQNGEHDPFYLGGIVRRMDGIAESVGGTDDHIHMLVSLRPVHYLADVMRDLKKDSTNWIKENLERRFAWQEGYAAFTVSPSTIDSVRHYIANQETPREA
jgi:transposase IS200 family protein